MTRREFVPSTKYDHGGWWAIVTVPGYQPYVTKARTTRLGARWAAGRIARKLNRLERKGLVR